MVVAIDATRSCGYDSGMVERLLFPPLRIGLCCRSWPREGPRVSGEEVLRKPMLIVMRHVPVVALLAGAVVLAGLALALPVLAALAPPEADADQAP